jgi:hypothetical protein
MSHQLGYEPGNREQTDDDKEGCTDVVGVVHPSCDVRCEAPADIDTADPFYEPQRPLRSVPRNDADAHHDRKAADEDATARVSKSLSTPCMLLALIPRTKNCFGPKMRCAGMDRIT